MLQLKEQPVGVPAQPPMAVSRSSNGRLLPTRSIASAISSKGMWWEIPLSTSSADVMALATPIAFLL